jgi:ABC-type ATPase involved in cell division/GNAT superfamily N-acetyltransferase
VLTASITRSSPVVQSARVLQLSGLFDLPPEKRSTVSWEVTLPLNERDWNVGLIVGPSGAGKTTIAKTLFPEQVISGFTWSEDRAVLDDFPNTLSIKEIVGLLNSVGFSSPPHWLRPFGVLSHGEQFRVTIARALAELEGLVVVDEFTSVVDRQVAKVASHTVQKAIRKQGRRFIAVGCHYDVIEWLQPDWIYEPHLNAFEWRSLRRRPALLIEVRSIDKSIWPSFSKYHYLSARLNSTAKCFGLFLEGRCVAFSAIRKLVHAKVSDVMLGHRLVVLPDYQGLGLGGWFDDWLGEWLAERGWRYHNVIAHPAMAAHYARSPRWKLIRNGGTMSAGGQRNAKSIGNHQRRVSMQRGTFSFAYIPQVARRRAQFPKPLAC